MSLLSILIGTYIILYTWEMSLMLYMGLKGKSNTVNYVGVYRCMTVLAYRSTKNQDLYT